MKQQTTKLRVEPMLGGEQAVHLFQHLLAVAFGAAGAPVRLEVAAQKK